eukprot:6266730-Prymnesium_polylepis.1
MQGTVANGAPYYKREGSSRSLYYDLDCNGAGSSARWILDDLLPDPTRSSDLDNDGRCNYWARL